MKTKNKAGSPTPYTLHPTPWLAKLRRVFRGEIDARTVALEVLRRTGDSLRRRRERAMLDGLDRRPARFRHEFAQLSPGELLEHFRIRETPKFFPGFDNSSGRTRELQESLFPLEMAELLASAARISQEHRWALLGYGEKDFGNEINWLRDLVSGELWPLDFHVDVNIARAGSDARVLWELNRLAHLITLGRAYTVTRDELLAEEFFAQVESWRMQNPVGRGPNWACAMEVALRAMNLLAAFQLFRVSPTLNEERLMRLLEMFEQHGAHIRRNLEFSYIGTSNHYLSDVAGLLWLGLMLPELAVAGEWREFGKRELLREMDVQVLADGADAEASTGYHRFVLELFLYSFLLCRANEIEIPNEYWTKLYRMIAYVRAYFRPDGHAPLIGDTDNGQVLPIVRRKADDHAYVLALGAAIFEEPQFKLSDDEALPVELLWILGEVGVRKFRGLCVDSEAETSRAFPDAGTYILREGDLYLLFNASGCGVGGRGSHGHNDALSIEVAACGSSFIRDPGTFVYRTDLHERHLFRSTAYHSTVEVDGVDQNTTIESIPFVMGDEANPTVLQWESTNERDLVMAEHAGYKRLDQPVTHRRAVEFDKRKRLWLIEDTLTGAGEHVFRFRFHLAPELETTVRADGIVAACDKIKGAQLFIVSLDRVEIPELESRWTSRDYGSKVQSFSVCWTVRTDAPLTARWMLLPVCAGEN